MSILGRIRDLLSANVNAMLDRAEDPEKMAEEYLRQLREQLYEAKTSVAAAMADERKLEQKARQQAAEVQGWNEKAAAALRNSDEELARTALGRKVNAQKLAEQYDQQYKLQAEQVMLLQEGLGRLEGRIAETQAKKELIIAKKNRARTQEAMQTTVRGLSSTNVLDKLDRLEERVDDQLNKATAMAELEAGSLENRFRELEAQSEVDAELEELKRQMFPTITTPSLPEQSGESGTQA
ncbi:MAG: phage shock protein A [Chloroflexaceae bacterium]|nr:phage shock protein A [Chloroflexaceae bacterium]NJO05557.1 phage shock protein A [Chloroflexaceae bacterium]